MDGNAHFRCFGDQSLHIRNQAVLHMRILRALWDHRASAVAGRLVLHIPGSFQVLSLPAPPKPISSYVTAWIHEIFCPVSAAASIVLIHYDTTHFYPLRATCNSFELGMQLSVASSHSGSIFTSGSRHLFCCSHPDGILHFWGSPKLLWTLKDFKTGYSLLYR